MNRHAAIMGTLDAKNVSLATNVVDQSEVARGQLSE